MPALFMIVIFFPIQLQYLFITIIKLLKLRSNLAYLHYAFKFVNIYFVFSAVQPEI